MKSGFLARPAPLLEKLNLTFDHGHRLELAFGNELFVATDPVAAVFFCVIERLIGAHHDPVHVALRADRRNPDADCLGLELGKRVRLDPGAE